MYIIQYFTDNLRIKIECCKLIVWYIFQLIRINCICKVFRFMNKMYCLKKVLY